MASRDRYCADYRISSQPFQASPCGHCNCTRQALCTLLYPMYVLFLSLLRCRINMIRTMTSDWLNPHCSSTPRLSDVEVVPDQ
ncbi:hypothetical protein BDV37DRAFT_243550 [Aspergillus pseudonomiae]|uniref:Uncharacterized protein n=1 Tax=Aspergillus pseudonomiae TaxID=1506151 RepID=A0A5N7DIH9_9EURO|nr:uncharacterized protein BDV37DRAFT_243550 [Aspergillus pseudonomiae]KAE8406266.1 hypothetical protein BDV37DRAFT_243550 [Aspergillus pseudonomiae]